MADALPTFDEALGSQGDANHVPTVDEAFGGAGADPHDSPSMDQFLSQTSAGRVMNAFGQGAKQGWGTDPIGYSGDTTDFLKKAGAYADHVASRNTLLKAFNVSVVRPAILGGAIVAGSVSNVMRGMGAATEAVESATQQLGKEGQNIPVVGPALDLEKLGQTASEAEAQFVQTGAPELHGYIPHSAAVDLPKARSLGVVGEGEGGYFGTVEPEPATIAGRAAAVKQQVAEQPVTASAEPAGEPQSTPASPEPEIANAPQQPDIHSVARQIAPDTFNEYDSLTQRSDTFRRWIDELGEKRLSDAYSNAPHTDEIHDLVAKMDDATPRLQKKYQARIDELAPENDAFIQDALSKDTPDMARVRQELQKSDYRMRDLAPDVAAAYRQAQEAHPELAETAEPQAATSTQAEPATRPTLTEAEPVGATAEAPAKIVPAEEAANPGAPKSGIDVQDQIANDVSKKLTNAGRPKEEADAAAQLVAAHYQARAERFDGAKGNAYELYAKEGPNIREGGARAKAKELAQKNVLHQIPPEVAEHLPYETKIPSDPVFKQAVENTKGAELTDKGLKINLERFQKPEQAGEQSVRTGVFYLPEGSASRKHYRTDKNNYGGKEDIKGETLIKSPLFVKGATGGKAPEAAYDALKGKGAYAKLEKEIMSAVHARPALGGDKALHEEVIARLLEEHGADASMAWHIMENSQKGNQLRYAIQENIIAHAVREAGHDAVVGYSVGRGENRSPFLSEVFDVRETSYPTKHGDYDIHPAFEKALAQSKRGSITLNAARNTIKLFKDADASTFIHETGHQWLEELMRDATDENAPEELKADAKTVRDYIGAEEGKAIPTRGHEKFARGFERYMMEGVAPSKELAGVFAKFKDWLTKIYQTVAKLRSPISDDIRSVFDRLLSSKPEKTVIAPERDSADLAATHEKLAADTSPERAGEVADKVRSDIDKIAKEKVPEVYAELNPDGGAEPAENANPPSGSDETGPIGGENGNSQELGNVPAGRNEIAPESGTVSGEPVGADTAGSEPSVRRWNANRGPTGEPAGSNEHFTNPESNLVDKAGNIRLDNLNTPEDVSQVIRDTASDNGGFMSARRGVMTDGEVLDLADALGMQPSLLDARKLGQAFNAEQVMAARKLLIKSATNLRDIMRKAADGSDAEVMAYAEAKARHIMIQEQVSGITAEAGRALRAFRKIEGSEEAKAVGDFLKDATGRTLNQLKEEAKFGASLETPSQVSKYMDDLAKHPIKNAVLEYYINALISGPITHFRYSVGNALNALWTPLVQIPTAAAIGAGREVLGLGADADRVYLGEAGAQLFAMMKGSRDGWKAATEAFNTGMSPSLPGERLHMQVPGAIPGKIGEIIRLPGKSVSAIHSFFKSLRYEQNIQGLAYRTAMNEGLSGDAFANRISDLTMRPTPDMMDDAGHLDPAKMEAQHLENVEGATMNSLKELYMAPTKYDSAMGALNRAVDQNIVAKIIVPFMKIGSQITRNAFVEQTPLGLFSKDIRAEFAKGGAAADFQAAKMAGGIALGGITVGLAAEGLATGDGPEDPRQRAEWLLNHRPNTVTVGDISIPYQGLGSLGMLMRFSANTYEVAHQIGHEDAGKLSVAFLEGATKSVLDENFMRGVKDALDAVYHPEEYGESYVKGFVTNWLPFSVGLSQVSRAIDPLQREVSNAPGFTGFAQSVWDTAKRKIPLASESLMPRRDMFGEPIPNSGPLQDYASDPVVKAMEALQIAPGKLTRKIRGIALTDDQYDEYSMLAGRMAKLQLNAAVTLPGFDQFPASTRIEMMHKAISSSREIARSNIMAQDPTIIQRATQAKIDPLKDQTADFSASVPENAMQ